MESSRVTIRIPAKLHTACVAAAVVSGLSLGEWLRSLAEAATGVQAEPLQGFASMGKRRLRKVAATGGRAGKKENPK